MASRKAPVGGTAGRGDGSRGALTLTRRHSASPPVQTGATPLLVASQDGHLELVKALIERRADVEAKAKESSTSGTKTHTRARARAHTHTHTHTQGEQLMPPSTCARARASANMNAQYAHVGKETSRERVGRSSQGGVPSRDRGGP